MPEVYTRTGDSGQTGLFGGSRLPKSAPPVEAYGTVDEANAAIGQAKAVATDPHLKDTLHQIQQRLFVLAAELASDANGRQILDGLISATDITDLERLIDSCLALTGPQRAFVVPGRDLPSAALHQARTVTRRAERRVLALAGVERPRPELIKYLNRLSDALYALARVSEEQGDRARIEQIVRAAVTKRIGQAGPPTGLTNFDLAVAKTMAQAAEAKATESGVPVVFAAVDAGGNLLLLHRMADSLLGSIDIAINKAFTAAAFKLPTQALATAAAPGGELAGIEITNSGRVVIFGGGVPVFVAGRLAGGIGVSGGTVAEDIEIVTTALRAGQEARQ